MIDDRFDSFRLISRQSLVAVMGALLGVLLRIYVLASLHFVLCLSRLESHSYVQLRLTSLTLQKYIVQRNCLRELMKDRAQETNKQKKETKQNRQFQRQIKSKTRTTWVSIKLIIS